MTMADLMLFHHLFTLRAMDILFRPLRPRREQGHRDTMKRSSINTQVHQAHRRRFQVIGNITVHAGIEEVTALALELRVHECLGYVYRASDCLFIFEYHSSPVTWTWRHAFQR